MQEFAKDVLQGLSQERKRLSSKYFYDDIGSRLFQKIMALPEYYLTNCEAEILSAHAGDILDHTGFSSSFRVVELGAGDGTKTQILLRAFLDAGIEVEYHPIDISSEALNILKGRMNAEIPELQVNPEVGEYFEALRRIPQDAKPSLVLFMGSNLGNYIPPGNAEFISTLSSSMRAGDHLLIGVDLKKNPNTIRNAYDDSAGVTRAFNLNLLERINKELGGDFQLENWEFFCQYDVYTGELRSYLVALKEQEVRIGTLDSSFHFAANEPIWTELSKKYSLQEIEELTAEANLVSKQHFMDAEHRFTDSLFVKS